MEPAAGAVVITGAAGGMGLACVRRFAGRPRVLVDLRPEPLAALAGADDRVIAGDIADPATAARIAEAVAQSGGLAALVHTAGLSPTMGDARRILAVNLLGTVHLLDALLPLAVPGGAAVLVASVAGHNNRVPGREALLDAPLDMDALARLAEGLDPYQGYSLSKYGVIRLAERRAAAWGARGARIVSLSPGLIDTPMQDAEKDHAAIIPKMLAGSAVPRFGTADEIAAAAWFLASPEAGFITGTDLRIDGGIVAVMRADPDRFR